MKFKIETIVADSKRQGEVAENITQGDLSLKKSLKDFGIKRVRNGKYPAIICIDGFLTKGGDTSDKWRQALPRELNKHALFVLSWDSKNLRDLGIALGAAAFRNIPSKLSLRAGAAFIPGIGPAALGAIATAEIAQVTKPWYAAMGNTKPTGMLLARFLHQTKRKYILVGHSLGARVIYHCLAELKNYDDLHVTQAHLLGGAVGNRTSSKFRKKTINWTGMEKVVEDKLYNYWSTKDSVLKNIFTVAQGFKEEPIGRAPITLKKGVKNKDVSYFVEGHNDYKKWLAVILDI